MSTKIKISIMQPYFLPYIGYWQLINAVDVFVVYDNIQYTKKGWFNRNRFLKNGKDALFSVALKNDSDYLNVDGRFVSPEFDKRKLIAQLQNAYNKAPYIKDVMPLVEKTIMFDEENLFKFIFNSIQNICNYLDIKTKLIISSAVNIDHNLKAEKKVIEICKALGATQYINPIGGVELYDKEEFENEGINLNFIKSNDIEYKQFDNEFVPWLSIVDVLMFNSKEEVKKMLGDYNLL